MKTIKRIILSTIALSMVLLAAGCASTESSVSAPVAKVKIPHTEISVGGGQV